MPSFPFPPKGIPGKEKLGKGKILIWGLYDFRHFPFSNFSYFLIFSNFGKGNSKIFQKIGKKGKFNFPVENNSNFPFYIDL